MSNNTSLSPNYIFTDTNTSTTASNITWTQNIPTTTGTYKTVYIGGSLSGNGILSLSVEEVNKCNKILDLIEIKYKDKVDLDRVKMPVVYEVENEFGFSKTYYCYECVYAINFRKGGRMQDKSHINSVALCRKCKCPLSYSLSFDNVSKELDYFKSKKTKLKGSDYYRLYMLVQYLKTNYRNADLLTYSLELAKSVYPNFPWELAA